MSLAILGRQPAQEPQRQLTDREVEYLQAVETAEERRAREEAARAQAEAEYQQSLEGRLEPYRNGEPPEGVSTRGLAPARGRYVQLVAWIEAERAEVARLEEARDRLLTALGAPALHQAELDALAERDKSGFISWVMSGALGGKPAVAVDAFRRSKIEAELQKATAEAEAARAGMAAVNDAIALHQAAVQALEARRAGFARAALREAAAPVMTAYQAQIEQLQATVAQLAGLRVAVDGSRVGSLPEYDVRLPHLGDSPARVTVTAAEVEGAAKPWREALKRLIEDPRANLETK